MIKAKKRSKKRNVSRRKTYTGALPTYNRLDAHRRVDRARHFLTEGDWARVALLYHDWESYRIDEGAVDATHDYVMGHFKSAMPSSPRALEVCERCLDSLRLSAGLRDLQKAFSRIPHMKLEARAQMDARIQLVRRRLKSHDHVLHGVEIWLDVLAEMEKDRSRQTTELTFATSGCILNCYGLRSRGSRGQFGRVEWSPTVAFRTAGDAGCFATVKLEMPPIPSRAAVTRFLLDAARATGLDAYVSWVRVSSPVVRVSWVTLVRERDDSKITVPGSDWAHRACITPTVPSGGDSRWWE